MFHATKELSKEEKIQQQIKSYDREILENKFISLFLKYEEQVSKSNEISEPKKNESKPILDIKPRTDTLNFSDYKVKRRQQYLHKTYTNDVRVLNGILQIAIDKDDDNLLLFLTELNKELELKDTEQNNFNK